MSGWALEKRQALARTKKVAHQEDNGRKFSTVPMSPCAVVIPSQSRYTVEHMLQQSNSVHAIVLKQQGSGKYTCT